MKHRRTKLSLGLKIASILSCVAILSAGFAAWWIVKTPTEVATSGSFTVYEVLEKTISVTNPSVTTTADVSVANQIVFGAPSTSGSATWLVAKDLKQDALTATFTFTVSVDGTNLNSLVDTITVTLNPKAANAAAFNAAIVGADSKSYIAAPTIAATASQKLGSADATNVTVTTVTAYDATEETATDSKLVVSIPAPAAPSATYTLTINFGWGTQTGGINPYTYYNSNNRTYDDYHTEAFNMLNAIYQLEGASYDITVGATLPQN